MAEARLAAIPEVEIVMRRSARARRLTLRVSTLDGRVTLTLPRGVSQAEGLSFAESRADWIRKQLGRQVTAQSVAPGTVLPVDGRELRIEEAARGGPRIDGAALLVRRGRPVGPQAAACLKQAARRRLQRAADRHAGTLGRAYGRLTLRDTRSRWGSCSSDGNLMFSWRLILAPPDVLDYVAAHEVAHLAHMDHSPAFWSVVARLWPGYEAPRGWLRRHGAGLHGWRFDTGPGEC